MISTTIRRISLCMIDPCQNVRLVIHYIHRKCAIVDFHHHLWNLAGGTVIGYIWDFGDGTYSNEPHPIHDYNADGTWVVKLTVLIKHKDKCCTKTYEIKLETRKCDPC